MEINKIIDDAMRFTFLGLFVGVMSYLICSLPPSPKIVNTEYISDATASINDVIHSMPSRNGIKVSTEYGNYDIWDYDAFCKYKDQKGKQVIIKFKKDYYDNDTTQLYVSKICDI